MSSPLEKRDSLVLESAVSAVGNQIHISQHRREVSRRKRTSPWQSREKGSAEDWLSVLVIDCN
jgi:hypothetical protein